jgi:putative oxidoreductase
MATHGWGKLQMLLARDFDKFTDPFGVSNAGALVLATLGEFVAPLLVMLGLGTRFAAAFPVVAMGVAAFMVHSADPWSMETAFKDFMAGKTKFPVSKEPALLYLIPFLALVFTGAGRFSIDAMICARRAGRRAPGPANPGSTS